jgi:hypothetical protein
MGPENSASGSILGHGADVIRQHFANKKGMHPEGIEITTACRKSVSGVNFALLIGLRESQVQLAEGENAFV